MSEATARLVAVIGVVAFAVGIFLGASDLKVPALNGTQDCGSAFSASDYADVAGSFIVGECDSKRSDRLTASIVAIVIGVGLTGFAGYQLRWPTVTFVTDKLGIAPPVDR